LVLGLKFEINYINFVDEPPTKLIREASEEGVLLHVVIVERTVWNSNVHQQLARLNPHSLHSIYN